MNSISESEVSLNQLIIKAEQDDSYLYELAFNYVYLMASSNIGLIESHNEKILSVINKWRGSFKIANALYCLVKGYSLFFLTKPKEGLVELEKMFDYCDDTDIFIGIKGVGLMGQGVCNRSLGRFDKTMENCLGSLQYIERSKGKSEVYHVYVYRMLGEIHTYIGELEEALNYYLKAESVFDTLSSSLLSTAKFRVYDAIGNCYCEMGNTEEAEKYLTKAKEIPNLSEAEKARVLCDFGVLYIHEPEKALNYFEESCEVRQKANLEDAYTTSLIYKAECLIMLNKLAEAEDVLKEAIPLVDKYNVPSKRLHLYQQFSSLNEKKEDFKEANKYFHLYDKLKTEIHLEQNKNIFHIKNKMISDQHQEIEQKHAELKDTLSELARIKVSRKALIFSILTVVVLVILSEMFLEPMIEEYSMNQYISIGAKIAIAFLLKPIDSLYERLLFRKAYKA